VITGRREKFESRCRERGYTLEQVRPCIIAEHGDTITVDEKHPAYPHPRRPGLGDMVKAGLSAVGITEERVSKAIGRPCGCSKRAERLNELGRKFGIG
jgi:hypothetical protein